MKKVQRVISMAIMLVAVIVMAGTANATAIKTFSEDNLDIKIKSSEPVFMIKLTSNPSTGYAWALRRYDTKLLTLVKHKFEASNTSLMGAPGYETWTFEVIESAFRAAGHTKVYFIYSRPWERVKHGKEVVFNVTAKN